MLKPLVVCMLLILALGRLNAAPLAVRVWQFQDYDMDHIRRLIGLAAAAKVNRIQLSHEIVMDVEEPLGKPQLAKDINTICGWAHAEGIKVDMWTHELNAVPKDLLKDGKADLDDPRLWEFVKDKYDRLFRLCPDLDGLVLTMQETAMSIYHERSVSSSIPPERRVAKLVDDMASVCASFGKKLFVRTFSYEPGELRYIQEGLKLCKGDITVMTKCVPHDWQPYYPFNPAIGDVGGKPQIVEFDLGHEFTGLSTIPYINIGYLKKHLDYDLSKGVVGAVVRVERLKWRCVDTPNQANIDVFTQMLLDPAADPHKLYRKWLADRYGAGAVDHLYAAFIKTFDIVNKGLFVLGFWVSRHSTLPDYGYATASLRRRSTAKWDPSVKDVEQALLSPTPETVAKIRAEKQEALVLADQAIEDIERARPALRPEDYARLSDLFRREKAMVVVWQAAMDVIFGISIYNSTRAESDRKFLAEAADRLESVTRKNRTHLINMAADRANPRRKDNLDAAAGLVELAISTFQPDKAGQ